jgi:hypothetical protein
MAKALELFAVNPAGSLADNAPLMLYTRYSEMVYFSTHIQDPKNMAELHSMRIASKRLRYTLEIFAPAYQHRKSDFANVLEEIKGCQEKIGEIHDCDFRIIDIGDYLNQNVVKRPEIRVGLQRLIDLEASTRNSLFDRFIAHWNGINVDGAFERRFVDVVFCSRNASSGAANTGKRNKANGKTSKLDSSA